MCCLQLSQTQPKPQRTIASLEAEGKWLSAKQLVKLIDGAKDDAVRAMQQSEDVTVPLSRQLHDAMLACTVFGYLPPLRLSCIRSLKHFAYTGPCTEPCCSIPRCRGNRVCVVTSQPLQMTFELPHHKNEKAWGRGGIDFALPPEFAQLMYTFLGLPHQKLCSWHNFIEADCPFVFMSNAGKGFDNATFSTYWTKWLVAHNACAMPPSFCRQVFVAERRGDARVAGPSDEGASLIMGNSVAQWDKWYDLQLQSRIGQAAVDSMQSWRQALLQDVVSGPAQALPSVQPMGADVAQACTRSGSQTESEYASCESDVDSEVVEIEIDIESDEEG